MPHEAIYAKCIKARSLSSARQWISGLPFDSESRASERADVVIVLDCHVLGIALVRVCRVVGPMDFLCSGELAMRDFLKASRYCLASLVVLNSAMQPFCNCLFCQVSPGHVSGFSRLLVAVCRKMWASRNAWGRSGAWVCRVCVGFIWEGSPRHVYGMPA